MLHPGVNHVPFRMLLNASIAANEAPGPYMLRLAADCMESHQQFENESCFNEGASSVAELWVAPSGGCEVGKSSMQILPPFELLHAASDEAGGGIIGVDGAGPGEGSSSTVYPLQLLSSRSLEPPGCAGSNTEVATVVSPGTTASGAVWWVRLVASAAAAAVCAAVLQFAQHLKA